MSRIITVIFLVLILGSIGFVGLLVVSSPSDSNQSQQQAGTNETNLTDRVIEGNGNEEENNNVPIEIISVTKDDIEKVLQQNPELSTFLQLVKSSDINASILNSQFITILAPSNSAFSKLPTNEIERLLDAENSNSLNDIILNHIVGEELNINNIFEFNGNSVKNMNQQEINITIEKGQASVNSSRISDFESFKEGNLVIHIIDTIISI